MAWCLLTLPLAHLLLQRPLPLARPPTNIPIFITPSAPPSIPPVREHVIAVLMKLPPTTAEGQNLRSWATYHSLTSHEDFLLFVSSDDTDHALKPDNFLHTTFHQFMSWKLNEITTSSPSPPPSDTASDPRAAPSTPSCSTQLLNFKRGIKRDISAYPSLKDEKYYESFKRSVLVTARAHDCEEILQPTFRPRGDADSLELFRLKNDFMYSVFNKCLLSDMGKTIV